jgi:hypothetical protein
MNDGDNVAWEHITQYQRNQFAPLKVSTNQHSKQDSGLIDLV